MLKVGGKPILQRIIKTFKDCGYKDLIICVNYKSHIIEIISVMEASLE